MNLVPLIRRYAPLTVLLAVVLAYANSTGGVFVLDDLPNIVENPSIRSLSPGVWLKPDDHLAGAGRPMLQLSLAINYAIGELNPRGYHVFNIALHGLAALALLGVLRRVMRRLNHPAADTIALAATLLWAVHPLLTDTVTYTINRSEALMGLFYLLSVYGLLRAVESPAGGRWLAVSVAAGLLAAMAKEVAATLPLVLVLIDVVLVTRSWRETFRRRRWYYAALLSIWVLIGLLLMTVSLRSKLGGTEAHLTPWTNLTLQSQVVVHYLRLAIWPAPLVIDYIDWLPPQRPVQYLPQMLLLTALVIASGWLIVRRKPWGLVGAWVFLILGPTSSFLPLPAEVAAERRMYLPLAAIAVAGVVLGGLALRRLRAVKFAPAVTAAVVIVLIAATSWRNRDYADELTIWADVMAKRPSNSRAPYYIGQSLMRQGDLEAALGYFTHAVQLAPGFHAARLERCIALVRMGRLDEAIPELEKAIELDPEGGESARLTLAWALMRKGSFDMAERILLDMLSRDPGSAEIRQLLANVRAARDRAQPR